MRKYRRQGGRMFDTVSQRDRDMRRPFARTDAGRADVFGSPRRLAGQTVAGQQNAFNGSVPSGAASATPIALSAARRGRARA